MALCCCSEARACFWGRLRWHPQQASLPPQTSTCFFFSALLDATSHWIAFLISIPQHLFFQKSLKQRLGKSNIQARLGRPIGALARGAVGGRGLPVIQRGLPRGGLRGGRATRSLLRGGMSLRGQCVRLACRSHPLPLPQAAYGHICLTSLSLNL